MSLEVYRDLNKLHPFVKQQVEKILTECKKNNLDVDVFETFRSGERQKMLKDTGKSKTMNSYHRLGLAVDIVFKKNNNWTWDKTKQDWDLLAEIVEKFGLYSIWKNHGWDGPHAELRFNKVQTATLYHELGMCKSIEEFWEKYIDPRIEKIKDLFIEAKQQVEEIKTEEVKVEKDLTLFQKILNLVLNIIKKLIERKNDQSN